MKLRQFDLQTRLMSPYLDSVKTTGTLAAGTVFTTSVDDVDFQFVTIADYTESNTGSQIVFQTSQSMKEHLSQQEPLLTKHVDQRFVIPDNRVTNTLTVKVQNSASDTTQRLYKSN